MVQFLRFILTAAFCGILAGCNGPTEHRYRDIHIAFEYKGHVYNETWVNDCVAHSDDEQWVQFFRAHLQRWIIARWNGFAERLPDGSGVLFKFRNSICGDWIIGQYLSGHPVENDNYRGYMKKLAPMETYAKDHPADFYLPNVYWFDNVSSPTRIEVCIFPACSESVRPKVRVISLWGGETTSKAASDPTEQIPFLKTVVRGTNRFVGYACWEIPVDGLPSWGVAVTPDELLKRAGNEDGQAKAGPWRANQVLWALHIIHYPLANAWTHQQVVAVSTVSDQDLAESDTAKQIHVSQRSWYRSCQRAGDSIQFDDGGDIGAPIIMRPLKMMDSPTMLRLAGGETLDAGPKVPAYYPIMHTPNDPTEFSAAANKGRTVYLAEALELVSIDGFSHGQPVF